MTAVQLFLMALFHLLHTECLVSVVQVHLGSPTPDPVTVYGGNCWDATTYAQAVHGLVIPWPVSG